MGRPPKDDEKIRDQQMHLLVNKPERKELADAADAAGAPFSQWARDILLKAARRTK